MTDQQHDRARQITEQAVERLQQGGSRVTAEGIRTIYAMAATLVMAWAGSDLLGPETDWIRQGGAA